MRNIGRIPQKWAHLAGGRDALVDISTGERMTFAALDEQVRRVANALVEGLGLERGDRVAVLSRNSIAYQVLYFACARTGLVTQPLNWRLGAPELARIVEDGDPRVIVVAEEFAPVAEELRDLVEVAHWLETTPGGGGSLGELVARASDAEPTLSAQVGDLDPLFILYTGGTTGRSKGALHSHRSAAMGMLNQTVAERIVPTDVYMLTGQMFHIPIVLSMNYTAHGCPVVLTNFEPEQALDVIEAERVSAFLGITTMLSWMMDVKGFADRDLSSLRNIQYGGGPMPSTVVARALDSFPCTLIQGYGQTEGTTMAFLSQEDHARAVQGIDAHRLRSCGREGHITDLRVVDVTGNPVPTDGSTPGEIIVRSPANMLGYWRQPELTADTIRDGWMWTGDLATWDEDRYVTIVDRAKDMIISGGENIYSAQVEEAITTHPAVLECAVIGVPDEEWGENVHAVVVLRQGMAADERDIIDAARQHLASYQKPKSVEFVDALPKAPTGKILKRELRKAHWDEADRQV